MGKKPGQSMGKKSRRRSDSMLLTKFARSPRCLTVKGQIGEALISGDKPVENREHGLHGWRFVHVGLTKIPTEQLDVITEHAPHSMELDTSHVGCIVGAVHFGKQLTKAEAKKIPELAPWAFGPVCSVVNATFRLPVPVRTKGLLSTAWKLEDEHALAALRRQLQ